MLVYRLKDGLEKGDRHLGKCSGKSGTGTFLKSKK